MAHISDDCHVEENEADREICEAWMSNTMRPYINYLSAILTILFSCIAFCFGARFFMELPQNLRIDISNSALEELGSTNFAASNPRPEMPVTNLRQHPELTVDAFIAGTAEDEAQVGTISQGQLEHISANMVITDTEALHQDGPDVVQTGRMTG